MGFYEIYAGSGFTGLRLPEKLRKLFNSVKIYSGLPRLIKNAADDGIRRAFKDLN